MTFKGLALGLVVMMAAGCGPSGAKSEQSGGGVAATAAAGTPAAVNTPPADLLAFANGTLIVVEPADSDDGQLAWSPYNMIDEAPITEWRGAFKGQPVFVFELAQQSEITGVGIDNGSSSDESAAHQVRIEVSDQSESAGFQPLLTANLAKADGQSFKAEKPLTGRWIRLTVLSNGGGEYASVTGLRATGRAIGTPVPPTNVSGTYFAFNGLGPMHLKQEGSRIVGCYQYLDGQISGGVEGRMVIAEVRETLPDGEVSKFLGLLNFQPDGRLRGFTRKLDIDYFDSVMSARKESDDIGDCPKIPGYRTGAAKSQLETQISTEGRVRLDGVNFDFNSDVLQAASKPLLDQLAAVLKGKPDWKVTLEGHTDNIGGPTFNKSLSDRRARAVMAYLVSAGIPAGQLTAVGFSYDKPVASNDTVGGRAQNRRVELVKN